MLFQASIKGLCHFGTAARLSRFLSYAQRVRRLNSPHWQLVSASWGSADGCHMDGLRSPSKGSVLTAHFSHSLRCMAAKCQPLQVSPSFSLYLLVPPEGPARKGSSRHRQCRQGTIICGTLWHFFSVYSLCFRGILWSRLGFRLCALRVSSSTKGKKKEKVVGKIRFLICVQMVLDENRLRDSHCKLASGMKLPSPLHLRSSW